MPLRSVVIGSGWASEGHTLALRVAGVEVVALCGRTPEAVKIKAAKLGIETIRFDWRKTLEEFRPDIVAIATTAPTHREMVEFAAQLGCHILCEKPLGLNATEAQAMLIAVEKAGVKHGCAATSLYAPACLYAQQLLASGLLGTVREIESVLHQYDPPLATYTWFDRLELGGGMLNNAFTHMMSRLCFMTRGQVIAATGEAKRLRDRAPFTGTFHDLRDAFDLVASPEQNIDWREVDADLAYTVLMQLQMPDGVVASALFKGSNMALARHSNYTAFYGERGTLHLTGPFGLTTVEHYDSAKGEWQELPVPPHVLAARPQDPDSDNSDWNNLFREFVADIKGEGETVYPTFRDGWMHNQVIDAVRSGHGWTPILTTLDSAVPSQI
jgi:predicted dehydrogenase